LQLHGRFERWDGVRREQEEIATLAEADGGTDLLIEPGELGDGCEPDPDVQLVGELRSDPAGCGSGRPGTESGPLDQDRAGTTRGREVIESAGPDDAATNDDDIGDVCRPGDGLRLLGSDFSRRCSSRPIVAPQAPDRQRKGLRGKQ
jgi:hypothetical protein